MSFEGTDMTQQSFSGGGVRHWLARMGSWITSVRNFILNLLVIALIVAAIAALVRGPAGLKDNTTLVLDLQGRLVEQKSAVGVRDRVLQQAQGQDEGQTQLRDVQAALDAAAKDPKIKRVLLALDDFQGGGLPALREAAAAIERFKASGKPVVAWGSGYDQRQYYLAAHANELWMHPMGLAYMEGFARYRNYYKDAFDKLGVSANVVRAGKYKNFAEPYFANAPSKETLESESFVFNALWASYVEGVEKARKMPAGSIAKLIDELPQRFAAVGGNPGQLALKEKLVDKLLTRDELRKLMIESGAEDKENKTFRQVSLDDYLAHVKPARKGDAIGVVVAQGSIIDGTAGPGTVGGLSTAELVRKAREDESIKAIVLRVSSPGGSAFGSELVRRELELTRAAGKPVVVSMGDVAASGGYWISMAADEVWADPNTITGSIGVVGMLPTADKAMSKLGVNSAGFGTTWLAGAYDPRRPLEPRYAQLVQAGIDGTYTDFTTLVAKARNTTREKIDALGQGRVWTGAQAKERGLIDQTGSFEDALKAAATRAKMEMKDGQLPRVKYIEREPGRFAKLMNALGVQAADVVGHAVAGEMRAAAAPLGWGAPVLSGEALRDFAFLSEMMKQPSQAGKPFTVFTHCLCAAP
jgi:protease-4